MQGYCILGWGAYEDETGTKPDTYSRLTSFRPQLGKLALGKEYVVSRAYVTSTLIPWGETFQCPNAGYK